MLFFGEQRNRSDFPITFEQGVVNENGRQQTNPCKLHTMQQPQSTKWHLKYYRVIRRRSRHAVFWRAAESQRFSHNF